MFLTEAEQITQALTGLPSELLQRPYLYELIKGLSGLISPKVLIHYLFFHPDVNVLQNEQLGVLLVRMKHAIQEEASSSSSLGYGATALIYALAKLQMYGQEVLPELAQSRGVQEAISEAQRIYSESLSMKLFGEKGFRINTANGVPGSLIDGTVERAADHFFVKNFDIATVSDALGSLIYGFSCYAPYIVTGLMITQAIMYKVLQLTADNPSVMAFIEANPYIYYVPISRPALFENYTPYALSIVLDPNADIYTSEYNGRFYALMCNSKDCLLIPYDTAMAILKDNQRVIARGPQPKPWPGYIQTSLYSSPSWHFRVGVSPIFRDCRIEISFNW